MITALILPPGMIAPSSSTVGDLTAPLQPTSIFLSRVVRATTPAPVNAISLLVDTSYAVTSSTTIPATTKTSTSNQSFNSAIAVSIVIATLIIAAVAVPTALLIRLYELQRQAPRPRLHRNVLCRPGSHQRQRTTSEFWSADASKLRSEFSLSVMGSKKYAPPLEQVRVMPDMPWAQARGRSVGITRAPCPNVMGTRGPVGGNPYPMPQRPAPTRYPEHIVEDDTTDVEQNPRLLGTDQPRISETYFYSSELDEASAKRSGSTVHSCSLFDHTTTNEPAYLIQRPTSSIHHSSSILSSRHQSSDPFAFDNLALGSPASLSAPWRSTIAIVGPHPPLRTFPLPRTPCSFESTIQSPQPSRSSHYLQAPQPAFHSNIPQILASSRHDYHPISSGFARNLFYVPSSIENRFEPLLIHDGGIDGVRYSRECSILSPALPDSVRTSVLSISERRS